MTRLPLTTTFTLGLIVILCVAGWAYLPGLHGGFLFDDFANLPALGATGPVTHWDTFWRYITSGTADPTGRPVALLSFLIDARNWPASPYPFLRTNIALHLLNGILLAFLLRRLGRTIDTKQRGRAELAALIGAACWLLHPLLVSTTLYIVQREAMLAATFVLIGLLSWLHGRHLLYHGQRVSGTFWYLFGLGTCTVLAVLSKANGILLPALALTLEYTVLRHADESTGHSSSAFHQRLMLALGWLPSLLVALYLLNTAWHGLTHSVASTRSWTVGQRLLTEPRVLMHYLDLLWLPRPFTAGLFNDQFRASASLLSPWSTLPAMLAVMALIAAGVMLRKRMPVIAGAILFYFVGQALESTSLPLELYFEHRNYLPAILMFWPLALWVCGIPIVSTRGTRSSTAWHMPGYWTYIRAAFIIVVLGGLFAFTHMRTSLWGNTRDQALLWAQLNPNSPRAQANAASAMMSAGKNQEAARRLQALLHRKPDQVQLALNLFAAQCRSGNVPSSTLKSVRTSLATTRNTGSLLEHWFDKAIAETSHAPCPQLNLDTLDSFLAAAQSNPHLQSVPGRRQDLDHLRGHVSLARGKARQALNDFNLALAQDVRISAALDQAAQLGSSGYPALGLEHLRYYRKIAGHRSRTVHFGMPMIHAMVLNHQHYWQNEFTRLHASLLDDASHESSASPLARDVINPSEHPR